MALKEKEIKRWVENAIKEDYTISEVSKLLADSGLNVQDVEKVLAFYNSVRTNIVPSNPLQLLKSSRNLKNRDYSGENQAEVTETEVNEVSRLLNQVKAEISQVVFGQDEVLEDLLCGLLCNSHALVEGVPGIAKTLMIKALAKASGCESKRIQFTADLLPSDITGIVTYNPERGFEVVKGPIFANFVIADEINRAPPKAQSALLEAMQERHVTIGRQRFDLPQPFFVMANNNPLETSGVYTLPEAQIDRFLFKLIMDYPKRLHEKEVMENNATIKDFEEYNINSILSPQKIIQMQEITKRIYIDDRLKEYILNIVELTRTKNFEGGDFIEWGASPRATIGLTIASKAKALARGRNYVSPEDIIDIALPVLRHRVILNYKAQAEGISSDEIVKKILEVAKLN